MVVIQEDCGIMLNNGSKDDQNWSQSYSKTNIESTRPRQKIGTKIEYSRTRPKPQTACLQYMITV